jgi:uncharacterized protein YecT (DUF1311 family)
MARQIFLVLACVTAFAFAGADDAYADPAYGTCMDTAKTSLDMSACGGAWRLRSEANLNSAWRKAIQAVGGSKSEAANDLLNEQRAWIIFKDKSCSFYYGNAFGSMHRSISAPICRNAIIEARTQQLLNIAADLNPEH